MNLANRESVTKIFLANIHRYTINIFGICTDCSLFTKYFLANSFYLYSLPVKYLLCTVTVSHFPTILMYSAEQIQFARTKLLHMRKPMIVYRNTPTLMNGRPISNSYFKLLTNIPAWLMADPEIITVSKQLELKVELTYLSLEVDGFFLQMRNLPSS